MGIGWGSRYATNGLPGFDISWLSVGIPDVYTGENDHEIAVYTNLNKVQSLDI